MAFLSEAFVEELRRFAREEDGFSFIDWAITISLVSMTAGFFIPEFWALVDQVMGGVINDVNGVALQVKHLK